VKSIELNVFGRVSPKGSMRAAGNRVIPGGSPQNAQAQVTWVAAVQNAARIALFEASSGGVIMFMGVPLRFTAVWRYQRPIAHFFKTGPKAGQLRPDMPKYPVVAPDTSKVLRSTEDALNKLVWDDDARIAETMMRKVYCLPGQEGAWIKIEQLDDAMKP
jgi:Holliday junction resolvase RusA-like endonuclease